ncbi:MAG: ABC transporter ATP-binding protein [Candidatus Omnitrophica bacterium]|nr:ABC transporter ATP-binding protein [Candidatus Omnitrophota bacterium]
MKLEKNRVIIRTINLNKHYIKKNVVTEALRGLNVEIYTGEFISVMGPSGSGKSTFFNMIGGLDKPSEGKVYIDEVDIAQLDAYELAWLRCRKIGYIFQTFNLIPVMSALENVMLPMIFGGLSTDDAREKAKALLETVGLGHRVNHKPFELSGGQQQRVAIARALANDPAIILADEPTGNLDLKTGKEIINLLREMNKEKGVSIITATHDLKMLDVSDRVIWLRDGMIERVEDRENITIKVGEVEGEEAG